MSSSEALRYLSVIWCRSIIVRSARSCQVLKHCVTCWLLDVDQESYGQLIHVGVLKHCITCWLLDINQESHSQCVHVRVWKHCYLLVIRCRSRIAQSPHSCKGEERLFMSRFGNTALSVDYELLYKNHAVSLVRSGSEALHYLTVIRCRSRTMQLPHSCRGSETLRYLLVISYSTRIMQPTLIHIRFWS